MQTFLLWGELLQWNCMAPSTPLLYPPPCLSTSFLYNFFFHCICEIFNFLLVRWIFFPLLSLQNTNNPTHARDVDGLIRGKHKKWSPRVCWKLLWNRFAATSEGQALNVKSFGALFNNVAPQSLLDSAKLTKFHKNFKISFKNHTNIAKSF